MEPLSQLLPCTLLTQTRGGSNEHSGQSAQRSNRRLQSSAQAGTAVAVTVTACQSRLSEGTVGQSEGAQRATECGLKWEHRGSEGVRQHCSEGEAREPRGAGPLRPISAARASQAQPLQALPLASPASSTAQ